MSKSLYDSSEDLALGLRLMEEQYPHILVMQIAVIQGGGIKTIWKMDTSEGVLCLKRIRKSIPVVEFTSAVQVFLANKGALVARIVPTKEDERYFVHEGYGLILYRWIEGSDLDMERFADHLEHGLRGLGRFHLQTAGFVPPEGYEVYDRMGVWPDHYARMLKDLRKWKQAAEEKPSDFNTVFLSVIDEVIGLGELAFSLLESSCYSNWVAEIGEHGYMCHQDYGKGNALLTEQGVYVLDLDNLAYDIPLRDVRKLIAKRMEELGAWDAAELSHGVSVYRAEFPLTEEQLRILYIDLLFPHHFHGIGKNVFNKGKAAEIKKLRQSYSIETAKLPLLHLVLNIKNGVDS